MDTVWRKGCWRSCGAGRVLVLALWGVLAGSAGSAQEEGVWEVLDKDGVVERDAAPELSSPVEVTFEPVTVDTQMVPAGPGTVLQVEQVASAGMGGQPATGSFDLGIGGLVEDAEGYIWMAGGGVYRYDGKEFTHYTTADGLTSNAVFGTAVGPDGHLWLATRDGVTECDGQRWIQHRLGVEMDVGIGVAPDGTVWAGGNRNTSDLDKFYRQLSETLLYRYDGQEWRVFTREDGLPYPSAITHLLVDREGVVWLGGMFSFDGKEVVKHGYMGTPFLVDSRNRLWATGWDPIHHSRTYLKDGTAWYRIGAGVFSSLNAIAEDAQGRFWIFDGNRWGMLIGRRWWAVNYGDCPRPLLVDSEGNVWLKQRFPPPTRLIRYHPVGLPTRVGAAPPTAPTGLHLYPSYPNPFNGETVIGFDVPVSRGVTLRVLDTTGQVVQLLDQGSFAAGHYTARWDGRDLSRRRVASGMYFSELALGQWRVTRKMTLIK